MRCVTCGWREERRWEEGGIGCDIESENLGGRAGGCDEV